MLAAFVLAQAPPAAPQDELPLYRLDAKLVLLHTSVVDKNGKLIDWLYAKEQSAQSMLKILGYIK